MSTSKRIGEVGISKSAQLQGGLYMLFMGTVVAVTLYFGLIPAAQMGLRLDTLPMGIVVGLVCQLPLMPLAIFMETTVSEETLKRARLHLYAAPVDAPIAELFWSGVVVSTIVVFLGSFGLPALIAGTLGVLLGTGIHLCSHLGPMRYLVPEGRMTGWLAFFLTMVMNRAAFVISNNIAAPILGHALGSLFGLVVWRMKGQTKRIL